MAEIRAFRAFRYDLGRVGALTDVVAPPYDVIDPDLQKKLYSRSPHNAIRLELTMDDPTEPTLDKYTVAARTLKAWVAEDVLKQDTARALYVYEQEFTAEGETHIRRGFFARVRLEPFSTGRIYPHEQTLSGPKADRLKLYEATGFNLSPVFSLYPDEEDEVSKLLEPATRTQPPLEARDHNGVINRLWVVTDPHAINQVVSKMGPKPLYIADGHHRYETGLKYLEERKAAGEVADSEHPANYCLMMLVGMSDPGLIILPTHRLVSGLFNLSMEQLRPILADHFEILGEYENASEAWDVIVSDGSQSILGFGTASDGLWIVAKLKDLKVMDSLAPDQSSDWRGLAVSILHKLVLEKLVPEKLETEAECRYVHLVKEVTGVCDANECSLAVLVPPVTMNHVQRIAGNREKMPPKSTYFYPKLLTGMVFNSLKKD